MRTKFTLREHSLNFGRKSTQRHQWEVIEYAVKCGDANSLVGSPPSQGRDMVRSLARQSIEATHLSTDENRALAGAVQAERNSRLYRPSRNLVLVSASVAHDQMKILRGDRTQQAGHARDQIGVLKY